MIYLSTRFSISQSFIKCTHVQERTDFLCRHITTNQPKHGSANSTTLITQAQKSRKETRLQATEGSQRVGTLFS